MADAQGAPKSHSAAALEGIALLKQGCKVQKYSQNHAKAKLTTFKLSHDERTLSWEGEGVGGMLSSLSGKRRSIELADILEVVVGMAMAVCFGGALGMLFSGVSLIAPAWERIQGTLMRPMFWISGVFFAANQLPGEVRDYLMWNPMLHCVEYIRGGFYTTYDARHANPSYLLLWILICGAVGLHLHRWASKREDG